MKRKRDKYTSPETSVIRAEMEKVLKGNTDLALDVMDGLIRALQTNGLYIARSKQLESKVR